MQGKKDNTRFYLLTILAITAAIVLVKLRDVPNIGSASTFQNPVRENDEKEQIPVAVFSAAEPSNRIERALRQARNSHYDNLVSGRLDEVRPDTKGTDISNHWWIELPALPTAQSDAVVLGEIVDAKGYISNSKTSAYSEFTVRVEEVYKGSGLIFNNSVVADRPGATVQLPDGRFIEFRVSGQGMPQPGQRYVLFLEYDNQAYTYHILTGYALVKGRVIPLDWVERFAPYKGKEEKEFIDAVRNAVINPPKAPRYN